MKLSYLTSLAIASALAVGTLTVSNFQSASANPCAAVNPCAAAAVDPCAAINPCAAAKAVDPCAAAADPCAAAYKKGVDPCAAAVDPCAASARKVVDPCAAAAVDPCAAASKKVVDPCAAAVDPCAASAQKVAIATSSFETVSKQTVGNISIVQKGGKRYLELDESFRSASGPDLFVLLHRSSTPRRYASSDFVNLGRLQSLEGKQVYEIPETVALEDFRSAVIWCQEFDVTFGKAVL